MIRKLVYYYTVYEAHVLRLRGLNIEADYGEFEVRPVLGFERRCYNKCDHTQIVFIRLMTLRKP